MTCHLYISNENRVMFVKLLSMTSCINIIAIKMTVDWVN